MFVGVMLWLTIPVKTRETDAQETTIDDKTSAKALEMADLIAT